MRSLHEPFCAWLHSLDIKCSECMDCCKRDTSILFKWLSSIPFFSMSIMNRLHTPMHCCFSEGLFSCIYLVFPCHPASWCQIIDFRRPGSSLISIKGDSYVPMQFHASVMYLTNIHQIKDVLIFENCCKLQEILTQPLHILILKPYPGTVMYSYIAVPLPRPLSLLPHGWHRQEDKRS